MQWQGEQRAVFAHATAARVVQHGELEVPYRLRILLRPLPPYLYQCLQQRKKTALHSYRGERILYGGPCQLLLLQRTNDAGTRLNATYDEVNTQSSQKIK